MTKEQRRAYMKTYRLVHFEKMSKCAEIYRLTYPEKMAVYRKNYCLKYPERNKASAKTWYLTHPEKAKVKNKSYQQSQGGKIATKKSNAKRRQFGFVPLNKWFEGSEAHHINKEHIVYIPKMMHKTIRHGLLEDRNMEIINAIAQSFLKTNEIKLFY